LAATLGVLYGLVLVVVAVVLLVQYASGSGSIGAEHLTGQAANGVAGFSVLLVLAAILLTSGAVRLVRAYSGKLLAAPLVVVCVVGVIGEIVDLVGTATAGSDLIGLLVLVLAALPVVLVGTPSARRYAGLRAVGRRSWQGAGCDPGDQENRRRR
jgi:uncharacterized membrane protein